jgi:hypothetical protein
MQKIYLILLFLSTGTAMAQKIDDSFLEKLMSENPLLKDVIANKDSHRLQIVYTQINRNAKNVPSFKTYTYNLHHNVYFYPASTAKMPTAFLALQKLNELDKVGLTKKTTMLTDSASGEQFNVHEDKSSENGKASIEHYIKQIFMVSDNDANNRLYEFLGQEYINKSLKKTGYPDAQIIHRLGVSLSEDANRHTNPIRFVDNNGKLIFEKPAEVSTLQYSKRKDFLGNGYYKRDSLINKPFDFSIKNRLYLDDMTNMLLSILFPEKYTANKKFNLKKEDYTFLYKYMSQLPKESTYPAYDTTAFYDSYCKFLMYGSEKAAVIPNNIRIFNKIGVAYGFVTDIAYIVDFENNIEFALSATIHVNKDGIFNDDKYEYETIAWPFMKNLGKCIYDFELKREKKHAPNLKKFKLKYDK